jgi:transposase InsO family protein
MDDGDGAPVRARWARLRFMIIGSLLASPPDKGDLQERIQQLADQRWEHPTTSKKTSFSFSTIERWYYKTAGDEPDPFDKLARKTRKDAGKHPTISVELGEAIAGQFRDHRSWQYKLHYDNLLVLAAEQPELGPVPSYATVTRYMKDRGMFKEKKRKGRKTLCVEPREKRSWEVLFVNQLWHLDFHMGSRSVLMSDGQWLHPWLLGILDDHSRLACHLQWYLEENAENLIHGLTQAFQKRDLPRALLTDGGGAMKAAETQQGLMRQSITHEMTLPRTPEQNGKQENFWTKVETRLLPMLEGVPDLTLRLLNEATQAWVELEYNQAIHSETGHRPIDRFLAVKNLGRQCPDSAVLRGAFRIQGRRTQRRSDSTISVEGRRYELPSRYRALRRVTVRYARWDLSSVDLMEPRDETVLCTLYPLDRQRNADLPRRALEPTGDPNVVITEQPPTPSGPAPLLRKIMADYAANGVPPAYIPKDECTAATEETRS